MADPLSVAGSAVGIISLGLTVSQGLLAYYGPFKAYDEQIQDVSSRITSFNNTLKALEDVLANARILSSTVTTQSATVALDCIFNCKEGLERLENMLDKCRSSPSSKSFLGSKFQINRVLYPFKRDTLVALLDTMSWLQADLNTSLQILTMAMIVSSQQQTDPVIACCATNTSQVLSMASKSDRLGINIDQKLDTILKQMQDDNTHAKARPAYTPPLLQSALEHQRTLDEESDSQDTIILSQQTRRPKGCSCGSQTRSSDLGGVHTDRSTCEIHSKIKSVITLLHRRIFCKWAVRISLEASFESTRGAGGFSIGPRLEFRAIVPENSEIFLLLLYAEVELMPRDVSARDVSATIKRTQKALFETIRGGKASISDAIWNGDTILHRVTAWQIYSSSWDARSRLTWRSFISSIVQEGLSPDRANDYGETPADIMIRGSGYVLIDQNGARLGGGDYRDSDYQQITIDICSDLLKLGGYMNWSALGSRHQRPWATPSSYGSPPVGRSEDFTFPLIWRLADEKGIQDIDVPEELQPLVYKSKKHLAAKLRRDNDVYNWIESYTHWPSGLSLLLQSEHASLGNALQAACAANSEGSVRLLINDPRCFIGKEHLELASLHPNQAIVDLIVDALIGRRKRLQDLALVHLPREVIDQLNIRTDTLLNVRAYEACTLLSARSVDLGNLLERHVWSVFDCFGINIELASRLFEAGFRDVDAIDEHNETCLTDLPRTTTISQLFELNKLLQKSHWLISKGADVHHKGPSGSALHILGHNVGCVLESKNEAARHLEIQSLSNSSKALLREILFDNTRDDCECACSLNGSSPLTALLGGLFYSEILWGKGEDCIQILADLLTAVLDDSDTRSFEPYKNHLGAGILRFIIFQSLDLTHTCQQKNMGWRREMEFEEIQEIHDEEKSGILDLEGLLKQFLEDFEGQNMDLPTFITGPWRTHMDSFLSSRTLSTEEISKVRETGVILYE